MYGVVLLLVFLVVNFLPFVFLASLVTFQSQRWSIVSNLKVCIINKYVRTHGKEVRVLFAAFCCLFGGVYVVCWERYVDFLCVKGGVG